MEYKQQVQTWLDTPEEKRSLETGAKLMLQGNRNKILYQNVLKKSNFDKIQYELLKIFTADSPREIDPIIIKLETQVAENEKTHPEEKGKRSDHNSLPAVIQLSWVENLKIYPRMRSLHEKLKLLSETGTAADRIDALTELLQLDKKLRENWNLYDNFDIVQPIVQPVETEKTSLSAKQVSAGRKFLSDNKTKQTALIEKGEDEKGAVLLEKMQNRYWELKSNGETFAPEQVAELKALGIETE